MQAALVHSFCGNHSKAIECALEAARQQPVPPLYLLLGKVQMKAKKHKVGQRASLWVMVQVVEDPGAAWGPRGWAPLSAPSRLWPEASTGRSAGPGALLVQGGFLALCSGTARLASLGGAVKVSCPPSVSAVIPSGNAMGWAGTVGRPLPPSGASLPRCSCLREAGALGPESHTLAQRHPAVVRVTRDGLLLREEEMCSGKGRKPNGGPGPEGSASSTCLKETEGEGPPAKSNGDPPSALTPPPSRSTGQL